MKIEVRLFSVFTSLVPSREAGVPFAMDVLEGTTIDGLAQSLGLREGMPKIAIVKGGQVKGDYPLSDGDVVSIFPPLAGG